MLLLLLFLELAVLHVGRSVHKSVGSIEGSFFLMEGVFLCFFFAIRNGPAYPSVTREGG